MCTKSTSIFFTFGHIKQFATQKKGSEVQQSVFEEKKQLTVLSWPDSASRSMNLAATAAMAEGTQLIKGAHLTGGNTPFFASQANFPITQVFGGEIIKCALQIILGFGSHDMCPLVQTKM